MSTKQVTSRELGPLGYGWVGPVVFVSSFELKVIWLTKILKNYYITDKLKLERNGTVFSQYLRQITKYSHTYNVR